MHPNQSACESLLVTYKSSKELLCVSSYTPRESFLEIWSLSVVMEVL